MKKASTSSAPSSTSSAPIEVFLGIEGGGTRSTAILADANGQSLLELQGGPANLALLSDRQLLWVLRSYASRLPLKGRRLAGIAIGLAGARTPAQWECIRQAAQRIWPGIPCLATNDLETALAAATPDPSATVRVLILSGTGSCCFGRHNDGHTAKAGGRGHVIGDRGSACDISQRALRALVAYLDQTQKWPRLGVRLLESLQLNSPEDLIPWSMDAKKDELASLATAVFTAANERDSIAESVLTDAAQALAEDAHACATQVASATDRVQFIFNGGVLLKNKSFARAVEMRLKTRWPRAIFTSVTGASSWGAVHLALQAHATATAEQPTTDTSSEPATAAAASIPGLPTDHPAFDLALLAASPTEKRNPKSMDFSKMGLESSMDLMLTDSSGLVRAIKQEKNGLLWAIRAITAAFKNEKHLFYVGAGTSGRLGVLDASECPPTFRAPREQVQGIIAGGSRALWSAVEGAEDDPAAGAQAVLHRGISEGDVVVGIAASGRTPFVWGALAQAKALGATTILLCFNPGFSQLSYSKGQFKPDRVIAPNLGPEILTGSTRLKAGTATKLILNLFTTLAMTRSGKVISNLMVDLNPSNLKLRARAVWIIRQLTDCEEDQARAALESSGWVVKDAWEKLK